MLQKELNCIQLLVVLPHTLFCQSTHVAPILSIGNFEVLEGEDIEGIVVAKFPDITSAKNWYYSDAYKTAAVHRVKGSIYNGVLVEGIS